MTGIVLRRLALLPVLLWFVATVVFLLLRILPGDIINVIAANVSDVAERQRMAAELGLNDPVWAQYVQYLGGLMRGDMGISFISGRPVTDRLAATVPVTVELSVAAALIMGAFGVATGILAAAFRGTAVDAGLRFVATVLFSVPWFWFGILLILVFSVNLGWLPSFGRLPAGVIYEPATNFVLIDAVLTGQWHVVGPWARHLLLPALTVGLTTAGFVTRITRASVIGTMKADFVRTARMKGMGEGRVFRAHILRNAALAIVTIVGLQFGAMLGGSVIAEVVFSYPGVGRLMVDAIFQRDYVTVQGAALVISALYILVNLATDLAYAGIDPRLRTS